MSPALGGELAFPAGLVAVDKVGENLYLLRFRLDKKRSRWLET
jgi:hypothetical protein